MESNINLSLEQQFELRTLADEVRTLSREEAQEMVLLMREAMLKQKNAFSDILKNSWGLEKSLPEALNLGYEG